MNKLDALTPEIDRLIRDCGCHIDESTRTLTWSTDSQADSARIRALKPQIIARLREMAAHAKAENAPYVHQKALGRIVQFRPPSQAERVLAARQKAAERRMGEAMALLEEWRRDGIRAYVDWRAPQILFLDGEGGPALMVPSALRPEMLWLLRRHEPNALPMVPTHRWDGQRGVA